jgi:DNA-binding NarL/FixJ family response regulator
MELSNEIDTKIIIVDDNEVFRGALKKFLQYEFHYKIIAEASGGDDFFALTNIATADVILMDLQLHGMDGYAITKKLLVNYKTIPVIAITMHTEIAYLKELIEVGFKGCVFKSDIFKNIKKAITTVRNNAYYFPDDIRL